MQREKTVQVFILGVNECKFNAIFVTHFITISFAYIKSFFYQEKNVWHEIVLVFVGYSVELNDDVFGHITRQGWPNDFLVD